jgi:hypothetical protein
VVPRLPEARQQQWGEICSILDIKTSQIGTNDNSEYFSTPVTIIVMKPDTMWYPACQKPDSNKKFIDNGAQRKCRKCSQSWGQPKYWEAFPYTPPGIMLNFSAILCPWHVPIGRTKLGCRVSMMSVI